MGLYDKIFAALYDPMMARSERDGQAEARRELLAGARGRVLEIGAGTGVNAPHYRPDQISEVVFTEPDPAMARRLRAKLADHDLAARVVIAPAESLPFDDDSFDTVVATLVLCTVPDPAAVLAECRRVLKPDGALLFLEHVRSHDPGIARRQDRITPIWRRLGRGCHPNRDTLATIAEHFTVDQAEEGSIPHAPAIVRPRITGRATK